MKFLLRPCINLVFILLLCSVKDSRLEMTFHPEFSRHYSIYCLWDPRVAIWGSWMPFSFLNLCMCPVVFPSFLETLRIVFLCVLKLYIYLHVLFQAFQSLDSPFMWNSVIFLNVFHYFSSLWNTFYLDVMLLRSIFFFNLQLFIFIVPVFLRKFTNFIFQP